MRIAAIAFLSIGAVLSAGLMPNNLTVIPILMLSGGRAIALIIGLLFWVASGRMDNWGASRPVLALMMLGGVAAMTLGCFFIQIMREDLLPAPLPILYRVISRLLPIVVVGGAFLPSRRLFLVSAALTLVTGIFAGASWDTFNRQYNANLPKSKEQREHDELLAAKTQELERIPASAGLEPLLEFVDPKGLYEVRSNALTRIEAAPDWVAQLSKMLEGGHRLRALYVLTRRVDVLPADVLEQCWSSIGVVAREFKERLKRGSTPTESEQQMLIDSVGEVGDKSAAAREKHFAELVEMRDFLRAAKTSPGVGHAEPWVRSIQFHRVPQDAGIAPLLEFTGPFEALDLRQEALARIAKVPDSTAKLDALLDDSSHRLDALAVLAARIDELPEEVQERCWQAAGATAKEMASEIKRGNLPSGSDARKLSSSVGALWRKNVPLRDRHMVELAAARDVVRKARDEWERTGLDWADAALAAARQSTGVAK